jgi:hypothetical protein
MHMLHIRRKAEIEVLCSARLTAALEPVALLSQDQDQTRKAWLIAFTRECSLSSPLIVPPSTSILLCYLCNKITNIVTSHASLTSS